MKTIKPTKENILNDINIIYKEIGFINSKIYQNNGKYSYYQVRKLFGSINNAIKEFNKLNLQITNIPIDNYINKQELFDLANQLFNKNNYITENEFYNIMPISINKFDLIFGSFTNFLKEANLYDQVKEKFSKKQSNQKLNWYKNNPEGKRKWTTKISKEELVNKIMQYIKENNILELNANELYKNTDITQNTIKVYWKSFTEMKLDLGLTKSKEIFPSKEEIIAYMWILSNKHGKLTSTIQRKDGKYEKRIIDNVFGSFTNMLKEMGLKTNDRYISSENLLLELQEIIKKYGTINSILIDNESKYTRQTYYNRFGSITDICKLLNINYINQRSSISSSGLYTICLISKILCSNYELEKQFDWLINFNTNYNLKLDGYFEEYNLAIEYDGIQHFQNVDFFYNNYEYVKSNDKIKNQLCKENGIKLIRIKYDEPLNEEYLKEKLIKEGIIKE